MLPVEEVGKGLPYPEDPAYRQRVLNGKSPRVLLPHANDLMSKARIDHADLCFVWLLKHLSSPSYPHRKPISYSQHDDGGKALMPGPKIPKLELGSLRYFFVKGNPFYQHVESWRR